MLSRTAGASAPRCSGGGGGGGGGALSRGPRGVEPADLGGGLLARGVEG